MQETLKWCVVCGGILPGLQQKYCSDECAKAMRAARHKEWRQDNIELARERTRQSMERLRKRRPLYLSIAKRAWKYGITSDQYLGMLEEQRGRCAVCSDPIDARTAYVDHDHRCCSESKACGGCVRGLLCNRCNAFLGMALDDPDRLRRGAAYLESHAALRAV